VVRDSARKVNFAGADPRSDGEAIPQGPETKYLWVLNRVISYVEDCAFPGLRSETFDMLRAGSGHPEL